MAMTKILIVDANKINLELMSYLLNQSGYTTITCSDGQEALDLVVQAPPDLIICDLELPSLDGYQFVSELKNNPQLQSIPVIAITAFAMTGDRSRIRAAGFDAYIAKPITPALVVSQIETLLPESLRSKISIKLRTNGSNQQKNNLTKKIAHALIVDSFMHNAEMFKDLLETIHFHVDIAQNAKDAIDAIRNNPPNLILASSTLPDMSAIDFLKIIQLNEQWKSISLLMMSATHPTKGFLDEIKELHVQRFLLLPIDPDDFLSIINQIYPINLQ